MRYKLTTSKGRVLVFFGEEIAKLYQVLYGGKITTV